MFIVINIKNKKFLKSEYKLEVIYRMNILSIEYPVGDFKLSDFSLDVLDTKSGVLNTYELSDFVIMYTDSYNNGDEFFKNFEGVERLHKFNFDGWILRIYRFDKNYEKLKLKASLAGLRLINGELENIPKSFSKSDVFIFPDGVTKISIIGDDIQNKLFDKIIVPDSCKEIELDIFFRSLSPCYVGSKGIEIQSVDCITDKVSSNTFFGVSQFRIVCREDSDRDLSELVCDGFNDGYNDYGCEFNSCSSLVIDMPSKRVVLSLEV